jgi:hypothetical protein
MLLRAFCDARLAPRPIPRGRGPGGEQGLLTGVRSAASRVAVPAPTPGMAHQR